ncbi:MAG TPA: DUF3108 domain-containing protein [Opitutaceae bacterium]|nr:DUF3108 domain-containing protein [Opitutaceae bacterium]
MPRLRVIFALLPALLALPGRTWAAPALALGDGEALTYHVSWVIIPGAGLIKVAAQAVHDSQGRPQMRIVTTTSTRGLAWLILPFKAQAESLYDAATGRLLWLGETSDTRSRKAADTVTFDYARRQAQFTASLPPEPARILPLPPGDPTDLITCLLLARTWKLQPGQARDALVLFGDEFYELTIHALAQEEITTNLGTFQTVLLEPRMEKTPPKGMFKRGSTVKVWISQDERRLPVRFQVSFNFGSGLATLTDYHSPASAK